MQEAGNRRLYNVYTKIIHCSIVCVHVCVSMDVLGWRVLASSSLIAREQTDEGIL